MTDQAPVTFWQRFWPLFVVGLVGIATLPIIIAPILRAVPVPEGAPDIPFPALVAAALINPILLLAAATALGAAITPTLRLRSLIVESRATGRFDWSRLRAAAPMAIALGLGIGILTYVLDLLFQPILSEAWRAGARAVERPGRGAALLAGLLYGGITEEIMLRWGVLSLIAWIGWRLLQRGVNPPSATIMWSAIVVAAVLFGAGHLPAASAIAPLDAALVVRTVLLNALAGILFGWLFWRHHLEAAMLAHMAAHVGLALVALAGLLP